MIAQSNEIEKLATSLIAAQAEFPVIPKSHTGLIKGMGKNGPYEYGYHYADLADTVAAVKEILEKFDLAISQFPDYDGEHDLLTTRLLHGSGQWLEASARLLPQQTAQGQGSALSYARRYGFCAVLGIVADEDDDAQVATNVDDHLAGQTPTNGQVAPTTRREPPVARPAPAGDKTYLFVPFKDKDTVKALGARWDPEAPQPDADINPKTGEPFKGLWYIPPGKDESPFTKWIPVDEPA